jgi:hypothetical protein
MVVCKGRGGEEKKERKGDKKTRGKERWGEGRKGKMATQNIGKQKP